MAGIASVPLDTLIQRDAQRRVRRVTWITAGALTAMLVMGVMTTLAIQARNEAARQRAEAEGLVEYMLTDLREKLKGVGRLDVMGAVNERAMEYYGGDSAKGKLLTAAGLIAMGEDAEKNGKLNKAESSFRKAYDITQKLYQNNADNPDIVFAHAQSEYWVGYAHYAEQDYQKSEPYWQRYLSVAGRLSRLPGEQQRGAVEIGYASNNLCVLAVDWKRSTQEPIAHCGEAVEAQRRIAKSKPNDSQTTLSLANSLAWYADALKADRQYAQAKRFRLEQLALIDGLLQADPRNLDLAEFRITTLTAIAKLEAASGRDGAARSALLDLRKQADALVQSDPQNATWAKRQQQIEFELTKLQGGR